MTMPDKTFMRHTDSVQDAIQGEEVGDKHVKMRTCQTRETQNMEMRKVSSKGSSWKEGSS